VYRSLGEMTAGFVQIEASIADETLYYCNSGRVKERGTQAHIPVNDYAHIPEHVLQLS
jgi:hypothetical protein